MQTRRLYAAITATGDAVARIQVARNSRVKAVQLVLTPGGSSLTDLDSCIISVSLQTSFQSAVNDTNDVLAMLANGFDLTTSGAAMVGTTVYIATDVPIAANEFIYLHAVESGSATWTAYAIVHLDG